MAHQTRHDDSVRAALKAATQDHHDQAERDVAAHAPVETTRGYRKYLQCMRRLHHVYAPQMAHAAELAGMDDQTGQIIAAFSQDLNVGAAPLDAGHRGPPLSDAAAWGVGYVLEGSALGAAVVRQRVLQAHGADAPLAALNLLDNTRAVRWRRFTTALNTANVDLPGAVDAARGVFMSMQTFVCGGAGDRT